MKTLHWQRAGNAFVMTHTHKCKLLLLHCCIGDVLFLFPLTPPYPLLVDKMVCPIGPWIKAWEHGQDHFRKNRNVCVCVCACRGTWKPLMKSFNFISIIIHCQLVPFRQVCLSSIQLEGNELLSLSVLSFHLFQAESRPLPLPVATAAASKYFPVEDRIPGVLSVTHPDWITAYVPERTTAADRSEFLFNLNRERGHCWELSCLTVESTVTVKVPHKQDKIVKRKLTFTYSPLLSVESCRLKNQKKDNYLIQCLLLYMLVPECSCVHVLQTWCHGAPRQESHNLQPS